MMRNIAVGIDIGTYQIKVVVAESVKENGKTGTRILGTKLEILLPMLTKREEKNGLSRAGWLGVCLLEL